ncbi:flagellar basal body-associated FliL family protein [Pseudomonadales bacterium]|nr:flagellar basal body-associated FliL family protein [Pseudomonadales bacterium]MDB4150703.1 flagellar basal body-associated FliL family protein [Pseudomonadales bacterium]MDB9867941.1 flagellar basal body-associated FliL family protein [Pseudomonadales bacterium]MDB9879854.1 flagellar basal body-associated FliL family protein [Pseudomonadales bacterium]MDB9942495.1 flagellar basal body-associated FliL family protein [Pseudomonadales bacterium]
MSEEAEVEEKKKSPILLIVLIFVGILLLLGGAIGGTLFLTGYFDKKDRDIEEEFAQLDKAAGDASDAAAEAVDAGPQLIETPKQTKLVANYYQIPQALVANIGNSKKVMQVSVGVMTHYDEQVIANIEKHQIALRSAMIVDLRKVTEADVKSPDFQETMAETLRLTMNSILEEYEDFGGIEKVFFPEFIIQ